MFPTLKHGLCTSRHIFHLSRHLHKMRLVQFESQGRRALGVELSDGGNIVDVSKCDSSIPSNMKDFIAGGQANVEKASK